MVLSVKKWNGLIICWRIKILNNIKKYKVGSKVTAILPSGWILPIGGVSSGRVWACSLRSRLVYIRGLPSYHHISMKNVWQNCDTTISLWPPTNSDAQISAFFSGFRIWKILTYFFKILPKHADILHYIWGLPSYHHISMKNVWTKFCTTISLWTPTN